MIYSRDYFKLSLWLLN